MSLVRAAGIPELVCATPDEYVARAIAYGKDPASLAPFAKRLADGRDTCRLFDTPALIADLERLYQQMWDEFQRGELPVPDIANLDPITKCRWIWISRRSRRSRTTLTTRSIASAWRSAHRLPGAGGQSAVADTTKAALSPQPYCRA